MRMTLDRTTRPAEHLTRHIEVFEGNLTTGPFTLLVEKITKDGVVANNCGVGTSTQDAEAFTQNVVKTPHPLNGPLQGLDRTNALTGPLVAHKRLQQGRTVPK